MKRTLALILALVMVFALAIPAMAANEANGKITVTNPIKGQTYSIYRVFDLSYGAATKAYSYTVNSAWKDFSAISSYFNVDAQGYITEKSGMADKDYAEFAQLALAYAKENEIAPTDSGKTVFTGLPLGYYLLDSSVGALCSLTTTDTDAEVREKNAEPTVVKMVKEDSSGEWVKENTAEPGETVYFKTTINVQTGAENYVLHDSMEGFGDVVITSVKYDGKELVKTTADKAGDYSVELNTYEVNYIYDDKSDYEYQSDFTITFSKDLCDKIETGKTIVVEYSAVLLGGWEYFGYGRNETWLTYGDNHDTAKSTTTTDSFWFVLGKIRVLTAEEKENLGTKTIIEDTGSIFVEGAEFKLYRADGSVVRFVSVFDAFRTVYAVWDKNDGTETTDIISDKLNQIENIDAGTYYLEEITAPDGYNKLSSRVKIVIDQNGEMTVSENDLAISFETEGSLCVLVQNTTGVELPSTGGIGTTIFYIVGGLLVVGAAVVLVSKKRMSAEG